MGGSLGSREQQLYIGTNILSIKHIAPEFDSKSDNQGAVVLSLDFSSQMFNLSKILINQTFNYLLIYFTTSMLYSLTGQSIQQMQYIQVTTYTCTYSQQLISNNLY